MTVIQAALIGLYLGFTHCAWGYTFGFGCGSFPLAISFVVGLIMGDPSQAVIIGTSIQALYMGIVTPGGNIATDSGMATAIAVPLVMTTDMDVEAGLALAIPLGLVAAQIQVIRYIINGAFARNGDKAAAEGNANAIMLNATVYPTIVAMLLYAPVTFIGVYYGCDVVQTVLDAIPQWVLSGLGVAGGILPTIGFGLTIMVIGQKKLIPFFIMGFFMVQYFQMSIIGVGVFAVCIALLIVLMSPDNQAA